MLIGSSEFRTLICYCSDLISMSSRASSDGAADTKLPTLMSALSVRGGPCKSYISKAESFDSLTSLRSF